MTEQHRVIEDFCMIGVAVPESTSDVPRVPRLCTVGYSPSCRELIRVYPLGLGSQVQRWTQHVVGFVKDEKEDSRAESWSWDGQLSELVGKRDRMVALNELASMAAPSIAELNELRRSLAVIRPQNLDIHLAPQAQDSDKPWGVKTFPYRVRAKFEDARGAHDLSVLDWGCYEFMRKNPGRESSVPGCLHIGPGREVLLLVGNLRNRRNVWCVVSVLSWTP